MTTSKRPRRTPSPDSDNEAPTAGRRGRRSEAGARPASRRRGRKGTAGRATGPAPQATGLRAALWGDGWRSPQRGISASSTLAIVGLALVGLAPSELGAAMALVGTVGLMASVHRFGRMGPDEARLDA